MADANIFAQYLRPMKTVADYQAEGDAADLRRQQLIGAQRQNALAALTAQQTQAQLQDAADKRNALQGIYQRLGPNADPAALEGALLSNPLTMEQGTAFQKHRADIDKTRAEAAAKSAEVWSKAMTLQGELAKQVIANPTRETAMAAIDQMEAAAKQLGLPLQFQQTRASIAAAQSPDEIRKWAFASGVTAEKLLPHLQTTDYGGFKRQEAVDPVTGRVTATAPDVKLTVAPNTAATIAAENQRQRERLAQEKELAGQGGSVIDTDQGKMWVPNKPQPGSVIRATPVIGPTGLQPLQGKPSESVQKEQLSINQQRAMIDGAIKAVKETPSAFGFTRGAATLAGTIPESIAGRMDSDEERQARAFVFNNVSAVINERAGAAQSKQELARLRSFLPGETDSSDQVVSKMEAFVKYLGEKERGTTTAKPTAKPSPQPPQVSGAFKILGSK